MKDTRRLVFLVSLVGVLSVSVAVGTVAAQSAPDCLTVTYNGDGSEANPYEVGDVDQLQYINEQGLSANYVQVSDIDASDTSEWNGGDGFDPIGNFTIPFKGTFDGADHTISDLYIDRGSTRHVGLFGVASAGHLENVGLEDVNITGSVAVGGLVGLNRGTVRESYATGSVNASRFGAGGLVGNSVGTVTESHWDTESTGQFTSAGGATGLTTSEMTGDAAANNMRGFDFTSTWETVDGDYPKLSWQSDGGTDGSSDDGESGSSDGAEDEGLPGFTVVTTVLAVLTVAAAVRRREEG